MHIMHTNMRSTVSFIGIKLDMSKAYDWVEWCFLEAIMRRMGFAKKWVQLIMECVRTVSYAILINDKEVSSVQPTWGLWQRDQGSPCLFLLCAEALSSLLQQAEHNGSITGPYIQMWSLFKSSLFFADDSLLFCNANSVEWRRLLKILDKYEAAPRKKPLRMRNLLTSLKIIYWLLI